MHAREWVWYGVVAKKKEKEKELSNWSGGEILLSEDSFYTWLACFQL